MTSPKWLSQWRNHVQTQDDLVRFVDDVGFCTINQLDAYPDFPSQEVAMGRHDVLGHTWFWKDDLHAQKRIYYCRVFGGKPGFISFGLLPAFIATNGETVDELTTYGVMPVTTENIYRIIEQRGPIPIRELKSLLGPDARKASASVLIDLERKFIITKTGISGRERATYGYIWDLAERWIPDAFEAADALGVKSAREVIRTRLAELGVTDEPFTTRILHWPSKPS